MKSTYLQFILFLGLVLLQSCSSAPTKVANKKISKKKKDVYAKYGNFDKAAVPNNVAIIAEMIGSVQPELDPESRYKIASDISYSVAKHKVAPQIMVALIDTESDFTYSKVSTTGDLSLAQVNVDVWNKEFARMKRPLIRRHDLVKKDQRYAMDVMGEILAILKKRYAKKDRRWYARYHSNTSKYKISYLNKLEVRMKLLSQSRSIAMK